jgi:hypothetical protein
MLLYSRNLGMAYFVVQYYWHKILWIITNISNIYWFHKYLPIFMNILWLKYQKMTKTMYRISGKASYGEYLQYLHVWNIWYRSRVIPAGTVGAPPQAGRLRGWVVAAVQAQCPLTSWPAWGGKWRPYLFSLLSAEERNGSTNQACDRGRRRWGPAATAPHPGGPGRSGPVRAPPVEM